MLILFIWREPKRDESWIRLVMRIAYMRLQLAETGPRTI